MEKPRLEPINRSETALPQWTLELKDAIESGSSRQFVLYGNVRDCIARSSDQLAKWYPTASNTRPAKALEAVRHVSNWRQHLGNKENLGVGDVPSTAIHLLQRDFPQTIPSTVDLPTLVAAMAGVSIRQDVSGGMSGGRGGYPRLEIEKFQGQVDRLE